MEPILDPQLVKDAELLAKAAPELFDEHKRRNTFNPRKKMGRPRKHEAGAGGLRSKKVSATKQKKAAALKGIILDDDGNEVPRSELDAVNMKLREAMQKSRDAIPTKHNTIEEAQALLPPAPSEEKLPTRPDAPNRILKQMIENWQELLLKEGQTSLEKLVYLRDHAYSEKIQFDASRDILDRIAWDMRRSAKTNVNIFTSETTESLLQSLAELDKLEKSVPATSVPVAPGPSVDGPDEGGGPDGTGLGDEGDAQYDDSPDIGDP